MTNVALVLSFFSVAKFRSDQLMGSLMHPVVQKAFGYWSQMKLAQNVFFNSFSEFVTSVCGWTARCHLAVPGDRSAQTFSFLLFSTWSNGWRLQAQPKCAVQCDTAEAVDPVTFTSPISLLSLSGCQSLAMLMYTPGSQSYCLNSFPRASSLNSQPSKGFWSLFLWLGCRDWKPLPSFDLFV